MTVKINEFLNDYRIGEGASIRALNDAEKAVVAAAIAAYLRALGIETEGPLQVGDTVKWTSSGTRKRGHIVAIVPARKTPTDVGFPKAGGGGMSRDHVSYVLKGRRVDNKGQEMGSAALYWPHSSLVERAA